MNDRPVDKIDTHHRQQLSALVDGELAADEARFLLRRLQHDPELAACQERWQLFGDALRGQACAPAPSGFAERVAAAVAAEPAPVASGAGKARTPRRAGWLGWGGGAALAASVAAVALFMGRTTLEGPQSGDGMALPVVASQPAAPPAQAPTVPAAVTEASVDPATALAAAVPAAAVAAASRRQDMAARGGSATRTQQAARAARRDDLPERAVAVQGSPFAGAPATVASAEMPFGNVGNLQAKPWPRSSLGEAAGPALNASYPAASPQQGFYPFEPRLQDPRLGSARDD